MPKRFTQDDEKFVELLLHVATRCEEDPTFGATKLNKILFFADFRAYAQWGEPITGHRYRARRYGPAPIAIVPIVNRLQESGACLQEEGWLGTMPQKRLKALRPPNESVFSMEELALVDEIIEELWGMTAKALSEMTHDLPGWKVFAESEGEIPYESVFVLPPRPLTAGEIVRARELASS